MTHFRPSEFACGCGCGLGFKSIDTGALNSLIVARSYVHIPFNITSSIRCVKHNENVGGSDNSSHLSGKAFDLACENDNHRWLMVEALKTAGFKRIGIAKDFIHCDLDNNKNQFRMWVY